MIVIGIDPGKTGAIALKWQDNHNQSGVNVISLTDFDRPGELFNYIADITTDGIIGSFPDITLPAHIYIEQQWVMPRQRGAVELLTGYGEIITCCRLVGVEPKIITWSQWKKGVLAEYKEGRSYPKEASIHWCEKNHPDLSLLVTDRCKKPSNDMADAVCIAEYGWRTENK